MIVGRRQEGMRIQPGRDHLFRLADVPVRADGIERDLVAAICVTQRRSQKTKSDNVACR